MLLQNTSVRHYRDRLTTCSPPEVSSPHLVADAVQTCWRHKALLSDWVKGRWQPQKDDESVLQNLTRMIMAVFFFFFFTITKKDVWNLRLIRQ